MGQANRFPHYRLTQETAVVRLTATGHPSITHLGEGTVVAIHTFGTVELSPEMIEIESDGAKYALFAKDLAERGEPVEE